MILLGQDSIDSFSLSVIAGDTSFIFNIQVRRTAILLEATQVTKVPPLILLTCIHSTWDNVFVSGEVHLKIQHKSKSFKGLVETQTDCSHPQLKTLPLWISFKVCESQNFPRWFMHWWLPLSSGTRYAFYRDTPIRTPNVVFSVCLCFLSTNILLLSWDAFSWPYAFHFSPLQLF